MAATPDYRALFDNAPYPFLLIDRDYVLIGANRAYLDATGRTAEEILHKHIFEAFPANPEDPESTNVNEVARSIDIAFSTGKPHTSPLLRYAIAHTTAEGVAGFQERYWSAVHTPVRGADGSILFVSQSAIDVTDLYRFDPVTRQYFLRGDANAVPDVAEPSRLQVHEAMTRILSVERNQLQALFNQAPGFIAVMTGREHVFQMANEAYYQLVGHRDLIGRTLLDALPELRGQGFKEILDEVYETGRSIVLSDRPLQVRREPGGPTTDLHVDLVYQPLFDSSGRVTGLFSQGNDVTARVRAQAELRAADERKDQFLAMLAHELRNPLAPIRSAADVLAIAPDDPARVRTASTIISRQVRHMTSLVDDLLDVSRVTRGLVALDAVALDMKSVVANAIEQARPIVEAKGHALTVELAPADVWVRGDEKRLVQVVANLLNNAAKYTPDGGCIRVSVGVDGECARVTVSDDGIGMTADVAARAFELFAQADRASDRTQGGLGIGLALVKRLIELHDGSVAARSGGPGEGSEFVLRLPLADPVACPERPAEGAPVASPARLKVLVVDDNRDAAAMLALLVETLGHEVMVEFNARDGLDRALAEMPDACLLDIGLPDMDGNELARRIRRHSTGANAMLIAVTGYGQQADRQRTADAGFDCHLVKPVDAHALAAAIRRRP